MKDTQFHDDHQFIVKDRAYSYVPRGSGGFQINHLLYANAGATSLFTTVEDMALWDRNFNDAHVGGQTVLAEMLRKGKLNSGKELDYAGGLAIGKYRGLSTVSHGGADAGFRSMYLRFPEQRLSIILFSNLGSINVGALANRVADIYLAAKLAPPATQPATAPSTQPVEVKIDPLVFDAYVGSYQLFPGFVLNFTREGDQFFTRATGQTRDRIYPSSQTEFFLKVVDARLTFLKDGNQFNRVRLIQSGREIIGQRIATLKLTTEQLAACAGNFYSPELGVIYNLSAANGTLQLRHPREQLELEPVGPDEFAASMGKLKLIRTGNVVDGFAITTGRVRNLRFLRVTLRELRDVPTTSPSRPTK